MRQAPAPANRMNQLNRSNRRSRLLGGASALAAAMMLLMTPHQAAAQIAAGGRAFEADPTAIDGTVTLNRTDTVDTVRIAGAEAVITWRPVDTATGSSPIDILPVSNALVFAGDGNYTVLNRVIPADPGRAIQFNGTVLGTNGAVVGGNIWFYSPGGIIAGPNAVFLSNGLVLTSSALNGIDKGATELNFLGANAGTRVEVQPGAQLLANNYIVLWAPRVVQSGGVAATGNISYVGAESGRLTVTGGLFDMAINVGTDDPNGVVHTGISTGPTPVDNPVRAITMATVAKNDFVNMLVGGGIGYANASVATANNGVIVLSAADGAVPRSGNITGNPAVFNSTTLAVASGDLTIDLDGQTEFLRIGSAANNADFFAAAGRNLTINATSGGTISAADLFFGQAGVAGRGGTLSVNINDAGRDDAASLSGLLVGGNLTLSAIGNGVDDVPFGGGTAGTDGVGGAINIDVSQGGELTVGGTTLLNAGATAGFGSLRSGNAVGGAINIDLAGANSSIALTGNAVFDVSANRSDLVPVNSGGSAAAGSIDLALTGGALRFGTLTMNANAVADDSLVASGRFNGASGGSVSLTSSAAITGTALGISAFAQGGDGGTSATVSDAGGDGLGGRVTLTNNPAGTLDLQTLDVDVYGLGGEGAPGAILIDGGRGGAGFGGTIALANSGTLPGTPTVTLAAAGTGGAGGEGGATLNDFDPGATGGAGGGGFGGAVALAASGTAAELRIGSLINTRGTGGAGGTGGEARSFESGDGGAGGAGVGGGVTLRSAAGGALTITAGTGTLTLDASGVGGAGGDEGFGLNPAGNPGQNGSAEGGTVDLLAPGGLLAITGNLVANASAAGSQDLRTGARGADATGGTITVSAGAGGGVSTTGGLHLNASALAAIGEASAGTGRGGVANLLLSGVDTTFAVQGRFPAFFAGPARGQALFVDTSAYEPQSGAPLLRAAAGGDTFGGAINLAFTGGSSTISGPIGLRSWSAAINPLSGSGADPAEFINDAIATGGAISIRLSDSIHTWGSLSGSVSTFGIGGSAVNGTLRTVLDNASLDLVATPGGNGRLSFSTYVAGEISQADPDAIVVQARNGSALTAAGGMSLIADSGHGTGTNPITTGNVRLEVDNSTLSAGTLGVSLVSEAQAFRFPGVAPNTTGAAARAGDLTVSITANSTVTGDVSLASFALADSGANGGSALSGSLSYRLDNSTHTGTIGMLSLAEGQGAGAAGGLPGTTTGGDQTITLSNGASFTGDIDFETLLYTYHFGAAQGGYGNVRGGAARIDVTGSTADIGVLNVLFDGGADPAAPGFNGANISAGSFTLNAVNAAVDIGDAAIALSATGGVGGINAAGGTGTGGSIGFFIDAASSLVLNDAALFASGIGGDGPAAGGLGGLGQGGQIALVTLGDLTLNSLLASATGTGGAGSAGFTSNNGGRGGDGLGGVAEVAVSGATGLALTLGSLNLDVTGTGGSGGVGGRGDASDGAGLGGDAGDGAGGSARFRLTGTGATATINPFNFVVTATGQGGFGGTGGANPFGGTAAQGGAGGDGVGGVAAIEAGSGASLTVDAGSSVPFRFEVSGIGGTGGAGGSIDMLNGGTAGNGGNGGNGIGGVPTLRAIGGLISAADIEVQAIGRGGDGGVGGDDGTTVLGVAGNGGSGTGGAPLLQTLDGSPGRLTLGTVSIDASGLGGGGTVTGVTAGGQIAIIDGSADPAGLISMASLTVTATGPATPPGTPSLTIESGSGPITVTGNVSADVAGDINFQFTGNGRLAVGGSATLNAGGDINLTHTTIADGVASLAIATDFTATAAGRFIAAAGSRLTAGQDASITAQSIQFDAISAGRDLFLDATNGSITGVGSGVLNAARTLDLAATQAIVTGDLESDFSIALAAGTDVTTGNVRIIGADSLGDERIDIAAGGNVTLGVVDAIDALAISGAGLRALSLDGESVAATMTGAVDVDTAAAQTTLALSGASIVLDSGDAAGNLTLAAGAGNITLGTVNSETDLLANATGNIGFTALTGRVVTLGAGGNITGGTAAADRNVVSGVSRNVNLTAGGTIAITSASAIADVVVRGASFTAASVASGTGVSDDIDVQVTGAVDLGSASSGGQTVLSGATLALDSGIAGAGTSVLTSTAGLVDLGTFDSESFLDVVSAAGVNFGTLTARALSIRAAGNVTGTRAAADVALVSARPRNVVIAAGGDVAVTRLAAVADVLVTGASLTSLDIAAQGNLTATVGGLADIAAISTGGDATVSGSALLIGAGVSGGLALLTATSGDVDLGTWDAGGFLDIDAVGSASFDRVTGRLVDVVAGGDITGNFAASDVNLTSGRPRNVSLSAGGAVTIGEIQSIAAVALSGASIDGRLINAATTGTFTAPGLIALGSLTTGGQTQITAGSADIGGAQTGVFTAAATGAFTIDTLTTTGSAADVDIAAGTTLALGSIDGARLVRLAGAAVTGGNARAQATLDIDAGTVDLAQARSAGGFVLIDTTTGNVTVDELAAPTFGIQINSAGNFATSAITAGGSFLLTAAGTAALGTATVGGAIQAQAGGNLTAGNLGAGSTSTGIRLVSGGTTTLGDLTSGGLIDVSATGAITGGALASGGQLTVQGASLDITSAAVSGTGGIALRSTSGAIAADLLRTSALSINVNSAGAATIGAVEAGASARVVTAGNATLGPVTATTGQVALSIGGNLTAGDISGAAASPGLTIAVTGNADLADVASGSLLDVDVGGALTGSDLSAASNVTLDAGSIALASVASTGGSVIANAVSGDAVIAALGTSTSASVNALAGAARIGTLNSGLQGAITARSVTLGSGTTGGDLVLEATAGDIAGTGLVDVGGAIALTASGDIGFGSYAARGGSLVADAGGDIAFVGASSSDAVEMTAAGAILGGDVTGRNAVLLDGGSIAIGSASGASLTLLSASDILFDSLASTAAISLTAARGTIAGNTGAGLIDSDGDVTVRAVTVDLGELTAGGAIDVAVTGTTLALGTLDAANGIVLGSAGSIEVDHAEAMGDFTATAGLGFATGPNSIVTGGDIAIVAGGPVSLGNSSAGGLIGVSGAQIDFTTLAAGQTITLATVPTSATAGGNGNITGVSLTAGAGASSVATSGGSIALSGDALVAGDLAIAASGGNVTLGALTSTGGGLAITADGTVGGGRLATGTGDLTIDATLGIDVAALASGQAVRIESTSAGVAFGALSAATQASVSAATGVTGSGVDVGGSLDMTASNGAVTLTDASANAVGGNLALTGTQVSLASAAIGGNLAVEATASAIDVTGAVSVGGAIDLLAAGDIAFGDLAATGGALTATAGGAIGFTRASSTQAVTMSAGGAVAGGDVDVAGLLTISGAQIALNDVAADGLAFTSSGDILFDNVVARGAVSLSATGGAISGHTGAGNLSGDGSVALVAQSIDLGTVNALDALTARATAGDLSFGRLSSGSDIALRAVGAIAVDHSEAAGDFAANAGLGFATGPSSIVTGGDIVISAGGPVALGNSSAGGLIDVSGAQINFAALVAGQTLSLSTVAPSASAGGTGDITGQSLQAGPGSSSLTTQNGDIVISGTTAIGGALSATANGGSVALAGTTGAGDQLLINATNQVSAGALSAGSLLSVTAGQDITLGSVEATGDVQAASSGGNLAFATARAGRDARLVAAGSVSGGTLSAGRDGDLQADSDTSGAGDLAMTGLSQAVRNLNLYGANVTLADVRVSGENPAPAGRLSGFVTINAANGSVLVGNVTAPGMTLVSEGGSLTAGALRAFDPVIAFGLPTAIDLTAIGGDMTIASLDSVGDIALFADGAGQTRVTGATTAGNDLFFSGTGRFAFDGLVTTGRDAIGRATGATGADVGFGGGVAIGRDLDVRAANGAITLLPAAAGASSVGGNVVWRARSAGLGRVAVSGNLSLTATAGDIEASAGSVIGGSIVLAASGNAGFTDLTATNGDLVVNAGGVAGFTSARAGGALNITAARISGGDLAAGGAVNLEAAQAITLGRLASGAAIKVVTANAFAANAVSAAGAIDISARRGISLNTLTGTTAVLRATNGQVSVAADIAMPGQLEALGRSVFLRSTGNLSLRAEARNGSIDVATTGNLDVSRAIAAGDVILASRAGTVTLADVSANGPDTSGAGLGSQATAANVPVTVGAGNVIVDAARDIIVAGQVQAVATVDMDAGGTVDVRAAVEGRNIGIAAADLAISADGQVGTLAQTRLVAISSGGNVQVGGADDPAAQFVIDNDEFARIRSGGSIAVSAGSGLTLDQLDIVIASDATGEGNLLHDGRIDFAASESLDVIGAVVMSAATQENAIGLSSGGDIFLDASRGMVEINDGAGIYLGSIEVEANNFYALTEQALADVEAASGIAAIDERLSNNDQIDNPNGLIRTGTLDITTVTSNVFIQNTAPGTRYAQRRGFTVDALLISDPSGTNQPIVINGIISGQTGIDAVDLAQISSAFDPGSTINGCLIASTATCRAIQTASERPTPPLQDLIEEELTEEAGEPGLGSGVLDTPLIELRDPLDTSEDPLLDDPVTGAGNEDLWVTSQPGG